MKNLIRILIMLVAVGCGKTEVEKLTSEISSLEEETKILEADLKEEKRKLDSAAKNKKLKKSLLIQSLVGSYEGKFDVNTFKYIKTFRIINIFFRRNKRYFRILEILLDSDNGWVIYQ